MKVQFQDNRIPLFDLHCDTFSELYLQNLNISSSPLHISLDKAKTFAPYVQVASVWTDKRVADNCGYYHFLKCADYFHNQLNTVCLQNTHFILGVEDARILADDITRLQTLYNLGVRVLTLCWKGETCIGGGWDTLSPLTPFGVEVVLKCADLGITVDLSHASTNVQNQVFDLARLHRFTPIFSHSNSYSVCPHKRNISDNSFKEIALLGGVVGLSLCCEHLTNDGKASISTIIKHINHFLSLGGADVICLGCDLDGIDSLPEGMSSIYDLSMLYNTCVNEFGKEITTKLFFHNAYKFFANLLKEE